MLGRRRRVDQIQHDRGDDRIFEGGSQRNSFVKLDAALQVSEEYEQVQETEVLIKKEVAKTMSLPKNLVLSVWPDGDSWKVGCHSPNPLEDKECFELIRREADRKS